MMGNRGNGNGSVSSASLKRDSRCMCWHVLGTPRSLSVRFQHRTFTTTKYEC